ncbi:unnamed protein product, partial [Aureobasidium mustum]
MLRLQYILNSDSISILVDPTNCGEDRPGEGPRLEIVAKEGHSVTIEQFFSVVHLCLRELKGQLRSAASVWAGWGLREDPEMIVRLYAMPIRVDDTRGWTPGWIAMEVKTQTRIVGHVTKTIRDSGL